MDALERGTRIALLTSGGDSPGMNSGLRAAVRVAGGLGLEVVGIRDGYKGLIEGRLQELDELGGLAAFDEAARRGGTLLGTARSKRFVTPEGQREALGRLAAARIKGLVVLGGNGSLTGARVLADAAAFDGTPLRVVGLPASIDNDIGCTAMAIGVDTAMNTIVEACDRIADTARAHHRVFIVEVMGRDCGYLAMTTGIAAGASAVLFREGGKSDDQIVDQVLRAVEAAFASPGGRGHVLVIKSEGVRFDSGALQAAVAARMGDRFGDVDVRVTVLGHVVRGGAPTAFDRLLASRLANAAVRALAEGQSGVMAGWAGPGARTPSPWDPHVTLTPLDEVLAETARLYSGDSAEVKRRVRTMALAEQVLAL